MEEQPIRVLLVEDDEDDYLLTRAWLSDIKGGQYELDWARTYEEGRAEIDRCRHDVYLIDYRLGGHNGLDLLREAIRMGCQAPLIFQTVVREHEIDLEVMKAGAADYLVKGQINGATLERTIRYALERKRSADALCKAREELESRVAERTGELAEVNARLAEADRRKDEFIAMLGHELRNPLAPIRSAGQALRLKYGDDPVIGRLADMIERQSGHMARLIEDLLDVSRISRGKIELRPEPVELAATVGRAVEGVRPLLDGRRHRLEVELPTDPVRLRADPARLEQILSNLLTNAAKYSPDGGHIRLTAAVRNGALTVCVEDDGIGIRPEMLPRLFELFQQADRLPDKVAEGLGVGLALVRRLAELHGGHVSARSDGPGQGSTFEVALPLAGPPPGPLAAPAGADGAVRA